ncbi:MAG: hypothetical protein IJ646_03300 [Clostridia bacterium]|nr:hypothetical protein [Clostridia bacterium]
MSEKREKKPYWPGHRERLRQRAEADGFDALRPFEVIELLLGYAVPRMDMSEAARSLITAFGSVDGVLRADRAQLTAVEGITPGMADCLLTTSELLMAYTGVKQESQTRIWRFQDLLDFLKPRWRSVPAPQVRVVYADYDDRVLCFMKLSDTLDISDHLCSRELMENALALEARYVYIIAFVGLEPLELYPGELETIRALSLALNTIDVQLMDFVLAGETGFLSLCREGMLDAERQTPAAERLRERYLGEGEDDDDGYSPIFEGQPGTV